MSTDRKTSDPPKPAWHELAEQATHEDDGNKLCQLVEEICDSIDAARVAKKAPQTSGAPLQATRLKIPE